MKEYYVNFKALYEETCDAVKDMAIEEDPEKRKELSDKILKYAYMYHKNIMHTEKFIRGFGIHRVFNED